MKAGEFCNREVIVIDIINRHERIAHVGSAAKRRTGSTDLEGKLPR